MRYELYRVPKKLRDFMCTFIMSTIEIEYMEKFIKDNPLPEDEKYVIIDAFPGGRINYKQLGLVSWAHYQAVYDTIFECKRAKIINEDGFYPREYIEKMKNADAKAIKETKSYLEYSCMAEHSDWIKELEL